MADEPIVALATPPGIGGISVLRVSGRGAADLVDGAFRGRHTLAGSPTHTLHFGEILDAEGVPLDQVVAAVMRAPHSYTGEDVVEVSCHGGPLPTRLVLERLIAAGARPAGPGEFTRRAFENGRIDLAQAEAVAELIHATSERGVRASAAALSGALRRALDPVRDRLREAAMRLETAIDFSEEISEGALLGATRSALTDGREALGRLLSLREKGHLLRDGAVVPIVGRPNVGKSSLLNRMLGHERSIVHESPGTTRDSVEERIHLGGLSLQLCDTAGLRGAADPVEAEGVRRSEAIVERADLVVLVLDASCPPDPEDDRVLASVAGRAQILVGNKSDLGIDPGMEQFLRAAGEPEPLYTSARTGDGIDRLEAVLQERILGRIDGPEGGFLSVNARQGEALDRARAALDLALDGIATSRGPETIAEDLAVALDALGEVTGESLRADLLDRIFSTFCIGK